MAEPSMAVTHIPVSSMPTSEPSFCERVDSELEDPIDEELSSTLEDASMSPGAKLAWRLLPQYRKTALREQRRKMFHAARSQVRDLLSKAAVCIQDELEASTEFSPSREDGEARQERQKIRDLAALQGEAVKIESEAQRLQQDERELREELHRLEIERSRLKARQEASRAGPEVAASEEEGVELSGTLRLLACLKDVAVERRRQLLPADRSTWSQHQVVVAQFLAETDRCDVLACDSLGWRQNQNRSRNGWGHSNSGSLDGGSRGLGVRRTPLPRHSDSRGFNTGHSTFPSHSNNRGFGGRSRNVTGPAAGACRSTSQRSCSSRGLGAGLSGHCGSRSAAASRPSSPGPCNSRGLRTGQSPPPGHWSSLGSLRRMALFCHWRTRRPNCMPGVHGRLRPNCAWPARRRRLRPDPAPGLRPRRAREVAADLVGARLCGCVRACSASSRMKDREGVGDEVSRGLPGSAARVWSEAQSSRVPRPGLRPGSVRP
mmetsp:Transcript_89856/g.253410  ORF Transcript_89856/g.253410 Transcript_89856/m.253410 type:complete len:489 (-) Transcript_89856:124-1590(-)